MNYYDDMHRKMTGKTTGFYSGTEPTFSPIFGKLVPGQEVVLPDDWDFGRESLFEKNKNQKVSKK